MSDPIAPKLLKWPFYLGDGLLLGAAYLIWHQTQLTMGHWELCLAVLCITAGALLGIAPALLEYRAGLKLAEAGADGFGGQPARVPGASGQLKRAFCSDSVKVTAEASGLFASGRWIENDARAHSPLFGPSGADSRVERLLGFGFTCIPVLELRPVFLYI